jgi:hypothetical protein
MCSHFRLGHEDDHYGADAVRERANVMRPSWFSHIYSRTTWVLEQIAAGSNSYMSWRMRRPSNYGIGIQQLLGGFRDDVPAGVFPTIAQLNGAAFGLLLTETDGDGNESITLKTGATTPSIAQDVAFGAEQGTIPYTIDLSGRYDARGNSLDAWQAMNQKGAGVCSTYTFSASGGWWGRRTILETDTEKYITNINLEDVDLDLNSDILDRFG